MKGVCGACLLGAAWLCFVCLEVVLVLVDVDMDVDDFVCGNRCNDFKPRMFLLIFCAVVLYIFVDVPVVDKHYVDRQAI